MRRVTEACYCFSLERPQQRPCPAAAAAGRLLQWPQALRAGRAHALHMRAGAGRQGAARAAGLQLGLRPRVRADGAEGRGAQGRRHGPSYPAAVLPYYQVGQLSTVTSSKASSISKCGCGSCTPECVCCWAISVTAVGNPKTLLSCRPDIAFAQSNLQCSTVSATCTLSMRYMFAMYVMAPAWQLLFMPYRLAAVQTVEACLVAAAAAGPKHSAHAGTPLVAAARAHAAAPVLGCLLRCCAVASCVALKSHNHVLVCTADLVCTAVLKSQRSRHPSAAAEAQLSVPFTMNMPLLTPLMQLPISVRLPAVQHLDD